MFGNVFSSLVLINLINYWSGACCLLAMPVERPELSNSCGAALAGQTAVHINGPNVPLPQYHYIGDHASNPDAITGAQNYLNTTGLTLPHEIFMTSELAGQVEAMKMALLEFGQQLGFDLTNRLPRNDHFHFFDMEQFLSVRQTFGLTANSVGVHSTSSHILSLMNQTQPADGVGTANHELLHVCGYRSISLQVVERTLRTNRSYEGYHNQTTDAYRNFNEALTEITNVEIISKYWARHPELKGFSSAYQDLGYEYQVFFVDALIQDIAIRIHRSYGSVLRAFQQGYFSGNFQALDLIDQAYGKDSRDLIASLPWDFSSTRIVAQRFGIEGLFLKRSASSDWFSELEFLQN